MKTRGLAWLAVAVLAVIACRTIWADSAPTSRFVAISPEELPATPGSRQPAAPLSADYVGAGSCASAACHGGPKTPGELRKWESSYSMWMARDPHAHAYDALHGKLAGQMVGLWKGGLKASDVKPWTEQRCLGCHSTGSAHGSRPEIVSDGVNCEACHGAARNWLAAHTSRGWNAAGRQQLGMTETKELTTRAKLCAECHVGSKERGDVDHDLIAAGHPRLNFEFSAYQDSLPAHWNIAQDRQQPGFEARSWVAGQTASADAALALTQWRAERATQKPAGAKDEYSHAWPELAEYDCYNCHHDLQSDSFRRTAAQSKPRQLLMPNVWNVARRDLWSNSDEKDLSTALGDLSAKLGGSKFPTMADASRVNESATKARAALAPLLRTNSERGLKIDQIDSLLHRLSEHRPDATSWDDVAQWYLAAVALTDARHVAQPEATFDEQAKTELETLRGQLAFNSDSNSAEGNTTKSSDRSHINSPPHFDPNQFDGHDRDDPKTALSRLCQLIGSLGR